MKRREHATDAVPADQVDKTAQSIAELHEEHDRRVGAIQKFANGVTNALGRPAAVVSVLVVTALWIVGNAVASRIGRSAFDRFPFPDLALFATVCAFMVTLLILTTQRHEQELARKREQLTLHMAVLTEKKIAKVIALLEEQRSDSPFLHSREDPLAAEMAEPADPRTSLDRIEAINPERQSG